MSSPALNLLLSRFPSYLETLRLLYRFDDDFKALCEDYYTSELNANKYHEKATRSRETESEYKNLTMTLEQEIIEYVKNRE